MQDRYVGDVGDFGKYALLHALAGKTLRLGILWYLNSAEEGNRDGKFTDYDDLAECDPILFRKLKRIVKTGRRRVTEIERGNILPKSTLYYRVRVPAPARPCYTPRSRKTQVRLREHWFLKSSAAVRVADFVFLDPDAGIAGDRTAKHHKRSVKYVFRDEIDHILRLKRSVVVYQHQQRKRLDRQISEQLESLKQYCVSPFALSFHARSVRIYHVLPATERQADMLRERAAELTSGPWKRCFRLHKSAIYTE